MPRPFFHLTRLPLIFVLLASCGAEPPPVTPAEPPVQPPPAPPAPPPPGLPPPPLPVASSAPTQATPAAPPPTASAAPAPVAAAAPEDDLPVTIVPGPPARGPLRVSGVSAKARLEGDDLSVSVDKGYQMVCNDTGRISVQEGGAWKSVESDLSPKGDYIADGKYVGYGMCDVMMCEQARGYGARLRQYKQTGQKNGKEVYTSSPVTGKIKVEFPYFTDAKCQQLKWLTVTLER